jgi:photosystem II stability/assembly factor-like uncharacterized protein
VKPIVALAAQVSDHRGVPPALRLLHAMLALSIAAPAAAAAAPPGIACQTVNGPCTSPDPAGLLATPAGDRGVVVMNFGMLWRAEKGPGWEFICDDLYGGAVFYRLRMDARGRVFGPAPDGLYVSDDGCDWSTAGGALAGQYVVDVDFDRQTPGKIWALASIPRALYLSTDGGRSFQVKTNHPEAYASSYINVAPSDGRRIYLLAWGRGGVTYLSRSEDAGESWEARNLSEGLAVPPHSTLVPLGVAPDDPDVAYFAAEHPEGDEIWRTRDGGRSLARVLQLRPADTAIALAFGASGKTLYLAGRDLFATAGVPQGRLYVSRDGGDTWAEPIPSPAKGPRFRCLQAQGGQLYACGAGEPGGDEAMVSVSSDEGKSWTPSVRFGEITGARACARARCARTAVWLCEGYGICGGLSPDARGDGGVADAGPDAIPGDRICPASGSGCEDGCSCELGRARGAGAGASGATALSLLLVAAWRRARVRRHARP